MGLPVRIATASVAGERLEPYVSEHVGLEAIWAVARMGALGPGAVENA